MDKHKRRSIKKKSILLASGSLFFLQFLYPTHGFSHQGHPDDSYVPEYRFHQQPQNAKLLIVPGKNSLLISISGPSSLFVSDLSEASKGSFDSRAETDFFQQDIFSSEIRNLASRYQSVRSFEPASFNLIDEPLARHHQSVEGGNLSSDIFREKHMTLSQYLKNELQDPEIIFDFVGMRGCSTIYRSVSNNVKKRIPEGIASLNDEIKSSYAESFMEVLANYKIKCSKPLPRYLRTKMFALAPHLQRLQVTVRFNRSNEQFVIRQDQNIDISFAH